MRTYRKRYGGKRLRTKKQRTKKQRTKKQRTKKQRTRRYRHGGSPGTELGALRPSATAKLFSKIQVDEDYQPSAECMKLQKALNDQERAAANYIHNLKVYQAAYDSWWPDYTDAMYHGTHVPTEPKAPTKPSAVTADQIKKVQKACGKHFVQNI